MRVICIVIYKCIYEHSDNIKAIKLDEIIHVMSREGRTYLSTGKYQILEASEKGSQQSSRNKSPLSDRKKTWKV